MKIFSCTIRESSGKVKIEKIEAESQGQVVELLDSSDRLILSIVDITGSSTKKKSQRHKKVKFDQIILFVRQFATMIDAGLPLLQSVQTLEEQEPPGTFKDVLGQIEQDVTSGEPFSTALEAHPKIFDKLFVSMIKAGEAGGFLSEILDRLADYMERSAALARKIKMALMYPSVVIFISMAITVVLMVKVVPVFEDMFKDFGSDLPLPTQILINISNIMQDFFLVGIILMVAAFFVFKWYYNTTKGRYIIDGLKFKVPLIGPLVQKVCVAKFASTLSALVQSGVPIISSLKIVSQTSGNEVMNRVLLESMRETEKGGQISTTLKKSKHIPLMVSKMIEIGESTGRLDIMLSRIEKFYTEQVNAAVNGLTTLIEPILIVFLGVVVGGIVISMFMPIFQISDVVA